MKKWFFISIILSLASIANAGIVLLVDGETAGSFYTVEAVPSGTLELGIRIEGTTPEGDAAIDTTTGLSTDGSTMVAGGDFLIRIRDASSVGSLDDSAVTFPIGGAKTASVQSAALQKQTNRTSPSTVFWPDARATNVWSVVPQTFGTTTATDYKMTFGNLGEFNAVGQFTLMDGLEFHAEGIGDVYVDLIAYSQIVTWNLEIGVTYTYSSTYYYGITGYTMNTIIEGGTVIDSVLIKVPEPMTLSLLALGAFFLRRRK
ncbi:MAG: PEP-CTERM sorting domain-containing protein [Planctomycetota bacterium]|jgi:hypothetical protein